MHDAPPRPTTRRRRGLRPLVGLLTAMLTATVSGTVVAPASAADGAVVAPDSAQIVGDLRVGEVVTAVSEGWEPVDVELAYAWAADGVPLAGEADAQLLLTPDLVEKTVAVTVTGTAPDLASDDVTAEADGPVLPGVFTSTPVPTLAATPTVGTAVTVVPGDWAPAATFTYRWLVDGEPVAGATGDTFLPAPTAAGRTLVAEVTGQAPGYQETTVASAPVTVAHGTLTAGSPRVTGTARVGAVATVDPGTWAPSATLTYQWNVDGTPVAGATKASYTPGAADRGTKLTVTVTGSADGYVSASRTSPAVTVGYGRFTTTPTPGVSGSVRVGSKVTAEPGTWSPGATLRYQWKVDGSSVSGATSRTFTPRAADRGKKLTVTVTGTRAGYSTVTKTSATKTVGYGQFTKAPSLGVSGTVRVGNKVTAEPGTWSPGATLRYQWKVNGSKVSGATSRTFTPRAADRGKKLTVTVTASRSGYSTVTRTSTAKTVGYGQFTKAPAPRLSGTLQVGKTLKATAGTWSPSASLTYQWRRNGEPISKATSSSYRLTAKDHGTRISVRVTAKRTGYSTTTRTTAASSVVAKPFAKVGTPTISGAARVGATLTAKPGSWSPSATYSYQWRRNGQDISGATRSTYVLTGADYTARISVKVTGRRTAYVSATRTSAATAKVAAPKPTLTKDGTYRVGSDIKPGTYMTGSTEFCYWERRDRAGSSLDGILANDIGSGRRIVTIRSTDRYFETSGCGSWTKLTTLGSPRTSVGDGVHAVDVHVRPGLYQAPGGRGEGCYWAVYSGFSGELEQIIENSYTSSGQQVVRIYTDDVGFESNGCGTWTRLSS